jgi:hypothetical protein
MSLGLRLIANNAHPLSFCLLQPAVIAILPAAALLAMVLSRTGGHLTYTLDDPYIHLALARNIWHGHYGLNWGEAAAPSSSILWPFLLAPFSDSERFFDWVPFCINLSCLAASVYVLDDIFADFDAPHRAAVCFAALLALNVYGIVFTGLEHSLQVLLVLIIVGGLVKAYEKASLEPLEGTVLSVSLVLLPWVRYEGLAISLPVLVCLYASGRRGRALLLAAITALPIVSFSVFLEHEALGLLPTSVLVKESAGNENFLLTNLLRNIYQYGFLIPIVALIAYKYGLRNTALSIVVPAAAALHFLFGKYGWFGRYEVYFMVLIVVVSLRLLVDVRRELVLIALLLPFCFPMLTEATMQTPAAASNIYNQQYQMAKIAQQLGEGVAVNDLGLVSLKSGQYVLDLVGLGSIEAIRARRSNKDGRVWIKEVMNKHAVEYAFVYDKIFPDLPEDWRKVGELRLLETLVTAASDEVGFYATSEMARVKLRAVLREFSSRNSSSEYRVTIYP